MSKIRKTLAMLLALAIMIACLAGCGSSENEDQAASQESPASETAAEEEPAGEVLVLKYGHNQTEDAPFHAGAVKLAEMVDEYSNGTMRVDVYSNAQLGDETELLEGCMTGTIDMCGFSLGSLASVDKAFNVFLIPFLFENYEQVDAVLRDGETGKYLSELLLNYNVRCLSWSESGFRHTLNSKHEVAVPEDLAGLKYRCPGWAIFMDVVNSWGANAVSMPFSEVYMAAQQGVIDVQEGALFAFTTQGMHEVQKYLTLDGHIYNGDLKIVSESTWQKLTPEQQEILAKAAYEAGEYQRELIRDTEQDYIDIMKEAGVTVTEVTDKTPWIESCAYVYDKFADDIDDTVMELIRSDIANMEK